MSLKLSKTISNHASLSKRGFYFWSLRDTFFCIHDRQVMRHQRVQVSRVYRTKVRKGEEEKKGIDFSAGLCEMKPGRAIAINNDKNNPIRRLFDLSAPIFRARSIRLITILLDLGGEQRCTVPSRAEPSRAELDPACGQSQSARDRIYRIVLVELYSRQ